MQKIINLDLKNIKRYLTGGEKIIVFGLLIIVFGFVFSGSAFADNVNYSVSIAPSLKLTIPDSSLILNLTPPTKTFDSKNLTVTVGTNNTTGYKLTLSTPDDDTNLNRDSSGDSVSATIPTLDAGTYTESTFTANKWGYRINTNTAIPSTITSDYIPFVSGNTLMESDTAVNHDETELTFAAKIDYLQPSGAYSTTLQFNIVANPLVDYMQDFTATMCQEKASDANYTVIDKRDNNDYTVRYINGNCWMTQNLRYQGDTVGSTSTATSWVMKSATSNINADKTMTMTDLTAGNSYDVARYHIPTSAEIPSGLTAKDIGLWYNYAAASAMTITGSSNVDATQSICPNGWHLPTISQLSDITSQVITFKPVVGGYYYEGGIRSAATHGFWWSMTLKNSLEHYYLGWDSSNFFVSNGGTRSYRYYGLYVRCIAK